MLAELQRQMLESNYETQDLDVLYSQNAELVNENQNQKAEIEALKSQLRDLHMDNESKTKEHQTMKVDLQMAHAKAETMGRGAELTINDKNKVEDELRASMKSNELISMKNKEQEEALQKHLDEIEAKAARVDELESKMANLEMDKEIMKKKMMAELKSSMAQEKRKLLELRNTENQVSDEMQQRFDLLGSRSSVARNTLCNRLAAPV